MVCGVLLLRRLLAVLVLGGRLAQKADSLVKLLWAAPSALWDRCCLELGVCCAALVRNHVFCVCQIAADLYEPACGRL